MRMHERGDEVEDAEAVGAKVKHARNLIGPDHRGEKEREREHEEIGTDDVQPRRN